MEDAVKGLVKGLLPQSNMTTNPGRATAYERDMKALISPSTKLFCLWYAKTIETVPKDNLFDNWEDLSTKELKDQPIPHFSFIA